MNQKQKNIIAKHLRSQKTDLYDAYKKPSQEKIDAYEDCYKRFKQQNGFKFKIIGRNLYVFSVGWYFKKNNKTYFHYETDVTLLEFEVE